METQIKNGTRKDPWKNTVAKYGIEEARRLQSLGNKANGGKANRGIPKSKEHKNKISESLKKMYANSARTSKGGRKPILADTEIQNLFETLGFKRAAEHLGISVSAFKGRYYRFLSKKN